MSAVSPWSDGSRGSGASRGPGGPAASKDVAAERIRGVRQFNRFYTNMIGLLRGGLLDTPYSLTEARVLFELAGQESTEVAELRRSLDIDGGYLSRILARFTADGLVARERSSADARRQVLRMTEAGRAALADLDERQGGDVARLLADLSDERQRRLLGAMSAIQETLGDPPRGPGYVLRPPEPGDLGWVVHRHGVLYAREYGWDATFEALVARVVSDYVDDYDPERDAGWVAEVDGERVGCVFCVHGDDGDAGARDGGDDGDDSDGGDGGSDGGSDGGDTGTGAGTAKLRLLLVEPSARGMGIGERLVEECLRFARRAGYRRITLWTNEVLDAARRIYQRAGFQLVDQEPHHSFGHDLVGQYWTRNL